MTVHAAAVCLCLTIFAAGEANTLAAADAHPIALRAEHFTVTPSTGPIMHVRAHNRGKSDWRGTVSVRVPEGWKLNHTSQAVTLKPGETARLPFAIEQAYDNKDNEYPVEVAAERGGKRVVRKQTLVCASAPYGRPKIDGKTDDWKGAIPVSFLTNGKRTTVRTLWNRREFAVLVEVEEGKLVACSLNARTTGLDAVQLAIAPAGAKTPRLPTEPLQRYEFLLTSGWWRDQAFVLASPGKPIRDAQQSASRADFRRSKEIKLKVKRKDPVTIYECAIPFSLMPQIEATEGREFCFSFLVHDPDGAGLRDWGSAAGLWPWQRSMFAWLVWPGMRADKAPPYDNKIEWGFCSSRY